MQQRTSPEDWRDSTRKKTSSSVLRRGRGTVAKPSYIFLVRGRSRARQRISHKRTPASASPVQIRDILEDMLQGSRKQMHDWAVRAEAKAGWARQTRTLVLHHASEGPATAVSSKGMPEIVDQSSGWTGRGRGILKLR